MAGCPHIAFLLPTKRKSCAPFIAAFRDEWGLGTGLAGDATTPCHPVSRGSRERSRFTFITISCFHRCLYLAASETKNVVEAVLEQTRSRHNARIYIHLR